MNRPPSSFSMLLSRHTRRREFIAGLGGAAAWPVVARAQQESEKRRIGVLMSSEQDDAESKSRITAFLDALQQSGWTDRSNVQIDIRWGAGDAERIRKFAAELVAIKPDVILATGSATLGPLLQTTRAVPIVFVIVPDPVGAGFIDNLAHPGGNATGFLMFEYGIAAKWVELVKRVAPAVTHAAIIRDPAITAGVGQFGAIQAVAPSLGMEVIPVNVRDTGEIERAIAAFAHSPNGALIVTASALAVVHRDLIVALAARYKLPAVYFDRFFVQAGGLISYGPDFAVSIGAPPAMSIAS